MKNVQIIYIFKLFYTLSYIEATEPVFLDFASSYEVNDLAIQEFVRVSKIKGNSSGINSHAKYLKQLEYNASNVIASKIVANNDNIIFEREPLEKLAKDNQLNAYKHTGFWQSMDTLKDKQDLTKMWQNDVAPWALWQNR